MSLLPRSDHVKTGIGVKLWIFFTCSFPFCLRHVHFPLPNTISNILFWAKGYRVICIEQNHTYFPGISKSLWLLFSILKS
jgi:hypothetical protein